MNKYLKYLLSLFLAFVVIANDGTIDSQSKSADYYQSSYLVQTRELDFRVSRIYIFNPLKTAVKSLFLIPATYLELKEIFSFKIQVVLKLQTLLYQKINSFMRQSVFVNETITSNHLYKGLYNA